MKNKSMRRVFRRLYSQQPLKKSPLPPVGAQENVDRKGEKEGHLKPVEDQVIQPGDFGASPATARAGPLGNKGAAEEELSCFNL